MPRTPCWASGASRSLRGDLRKPHRWTIGEPSRVPPVVRLGDGRVRARPPRGRRSRPPEGGRRHGDPPSRPCRDAPRIVARAVLSNGPPSARPAASVRALVGRMQRRPRLMIAPRGPITRCRVGTRSRRPASRAVGLRVDPKVRHLPPRDPASVPVRSGRGLAVLVPDRREGSYDARATVRKGNRKVTGCPPELPRMSPAAAVVGARGGMPSARRGRPQRSWSPRCGRDVDESGDVVDVLWTRRGPRGWTPR